MRHMLYNFQRLQWLGFNQKLVQLIEINSYSCIKYPVHLR